MGNAIWLLLALPTWFFPTILSPFSAGELTAIPALGVLCLVIGTALGFLRRDKRLLLFLIPAALSEVMVAVAGALRGQVPAAWSGPILLGFLGLVLVVSAWLVYRLKGARLPAAFLAVFALAYALFAAFIATMSFSDTWL